MEGEKEMRLVCLIAQEIIRQLADTLGFEFDSHVSPDDLVAQVVFDCLKEHMVTTLPSTRIPMYPREGGYFPEGEIVKRTRDKVFERNDEDLLRWGIGGGNPYTKQMKQPAQRKGGQFSGRPLNELVYRTIVNCARNTGLPIVALLKDGMIIDAKRASGEKIKNAYKNYGMYMEKQAQENDARQWFLNLLDISFLETSEAISFIYYLACYMEEHGKKLLPNCTPIFVSGTTISLYSNCNPIRIQSRFLLIRNLLIPFLMEEPEWKVVDYTRKLLLLHKQALDTLKKTIEWQESIRQISDEGKVNYFKSAYNLFDVSFPEERFTPSFIKKLREAARTITDPQLYQNKNSRAVPRSE